ncbi:hypothetical protein Q3A80_11005 [Burkholderia sp. SR8]|uniref:hypothetical protein n=1 Tax=Burkholderia sp. SR8 TaxID=3062277 RepID=UPI0040629E79
MAVSDEKCVLSMTAIMTAFGARENRSMLNQPFPDGKAGARRRSSGRRRSRGQATMRQLRSAAPPVGTSLHSRAANRGRS